MCFFFFFFSFVSFLLLSFKGGRFCCFLFFLCVCYLLGLGGSQGGVGVG